MSAKPSPVFNIQVAAPVIGRGQIVARSWYPSSPERQASSQSTTTARGSNLSGEIDIGSFHKAITARARARCIGTMDRIYLANIASAILLLLGAAGLYVTRTADLMLHAPRSAPPN